MCLEKSHLPVGLFGWKFWILKDNVGNQSSSLGTSAPLSCAGFSGSFLGSSEPTLRAWVGGFFLVDW